MYKEVYDIIYEPNDEIEINSSEGNIYYLHEDINESQGLNGINLFQSENPNIEYSINIQEENENIISQSNANINTIQKGEIKKLGIFQVVHPKNNWIFNFFKSDLNFQNPILIKKKLWRSKKNQRKKRGRNQDHLLIIIKRHFFNDELIKILNEELDKIGFKIKFEKFPSSFAGDVKKENNRKIIDKTLKEIFEMKELYVNVDKKAKANKNKVALAKYNHNLEIIQKLEKEKNLNINDINKILNAKYSDIYQYYINSEEFENYANGLKRLPKKFDDSDLIRFKYLATSFIQYFSE